MRDHCVPPQFHGLHGIRTQGHLNVIPANTSLACDVFEQHLDFECLVPHLIVHVIKGLFDLLGLEPFESRANPPVESGHPAPRAVATPASHVNADLVHTTVDGLTGKIPHGYLGYPVWESMSTLRSRLIRLAHENPDLRPQILQVLKTAGNGEKEMKVLYGKCLGPIKGYMEAYPGADLEALKGALAFLFYTEPENVDAEKSAILARMDKAERAVKDMRLHLADLRDLTTDYFSMVDAVRKPKG